MEVSVGEGMTGIAMAMTAAGQVTETANANALRDTSAIGIGVARLTAKVAAMVATADRHLPTVRVEVGEVGAEIGVTETEIVAPSESHRAAAIRKAGAPRAVKTVPGTMMLAMAVVTTLQERTMAEGVIGGRRQYHEAQ